MTDDLQFSMFRMSTRPQPELLFYESADSGSRHRLRHLSHLVRDAQHFGTTMFVPMKERAEAAPDTDHGTAEAVVILQFRWFLELLGSIAVQLEHSWPEPAQITLRAAFESSMAVLWLTDADTVKRAHAYLYWDSAQRVKRLTRMLPESESGRQRRSELSDDLYYHDRVTPEQVALARSEIGTIQQELDTGLYKDAMTEHQRLGRRAHEWYALWDGPQNLCELARKLRRLSLYEVLYRDWSLAAHALDTLQGHLITHEPGSVGFVQLGLPFEAQDCALQTFHIAMDLFQALTGRWIPAHRGRLEEWHSNMVPYTRELHAAKLFLRRDR